MESLVIIAHCRPRNFELVTPPPHTHTHTVQSLHISIKQLCHQNALFDVVHFKVSGVALIKTQLERLMCCRCTQMCLSEDLLSHS